MKLIYSKSALFIWSTVLTIFIAPPTFATSDPAAKAVMACAEALQGETELSQFSFIKRSQHAGYKSFSIWLNAANKATRGYCKTKAGKVKEMHVLGGQWSKTNTYRPR